ncbi:MAG: glycine cleavage system protein GcvH [Thermoguttaceae bacterium]|nr:glycine cleavage system protein GcvH [Thermoguttaceae bacterium]MDW8079390.1 glycine cleavage system protein GcvH [Thermoguttaceae bacterium]
MNPESLRYTPTHEWVYFEEQNGQLIATVGLTQFAVESLTNLVFLELPKVGQHVQAGKPMGVVESIKAVSDIYSPVDGEVIEVNQPVVNELDLLSRDPYGSGWLVKIRLAENKEPEGLLDHKAYEAQCASEPQ